MRDLDPLHSLNAGEAGAALLRCCGSVRWAERMAALRPFADEAAMFAAARDVWQDLTRDDWLEAFAAHPKIGDVDSLRSKFAHTAAWSAQEQSGMNATSEATIQAFADGNRDYEKKFGHIFIVCATGKTAGEMLTLLQARLGNDAATELRIAAAEQEKITRLRLEKLCP